MRFAIVLVFAVLTLHISCISSYSEQKKQGITVRKDRSGLPITVKSDELSADNKGRIAVFTGKVVSRQGDVTIYSDKLTVYYGEKTQDVDRIVAEGSVRILHENRVGTGNHAVYESRDGRITLTGNPKVSRDSDTVTGKAITYFIDDERSMVTGGDEGRVEAVIHPRPRKSDAAGKK